MVLEMKKNHFVKNISNCYMSLFYYIWKTRLRLSGASHVIFGRVTPSRIWGITFLVVSEPNVLKLIITIFIKTIFHIFVLSLTEVNVEESMEDVPSERGRLLNSLSCAVSRLDLPG